MWKMEKTDMVEAALKHAGKPPAILDEPIYDRLDFAERYLQSLNSRILQSGSLAEKVQTHLTGVVQRARSGNRPWNHNEADGYFVGVAAARFWALHDGDLMSEDLTDIERRQFLEIHTFARGARAGRVDKRGLAWRENDRFHLWSQTNNKEQDNGEEDGSWAEDVGQH